MRSILEVWDYKLSTAIPVNYRGMVPVDDGFELSNYWWACVRCQQTNEILELHNTGTKVVDGDLHDGAGLDACYEFYRSVRDRYAKPDIEQLKPRVAAERGIKEVA